jgi:hemerythrin-like domain-containing protein
MVRIIENLQRDHVNMIKLLDLLEQQIGVLAAGGYPDYTLMSEILDYSVYYSELYHHRKEDVIYRKLLERDPGSAVIVGELLEQHKELEKITRDFMRLLQNITLGEQLPHEQVEKLGRNYIDFSRRHLYREESEVFPHLGKHLRDSDWVEVEREIPGADDPLFGEDVRDDYLKLYERIITYSAQG